MFGKETVPKEIYDRETARADAAEGRVDYLLKQLVALKKKGYEPGHEPKAGRVVSPPTAPESKALERMHRELIDNLASDIEQMPGVPKEVARAEAERLRTSALGDGTIG